MSDQGAVVQPTEDADGLGSGAVDEGLLPTEKDVAWYREHGWWFSPVIVPDEILDLADEGMRRFYAGDWDNNLVDREGGPLSGWTPDQGERVLRKNDYSSLRVRQLWLLASWPMIAASAARLAGVSELRLWHDQLLYKPVDEPGVAGNVGWHTDRQYWRTCSSEEMLTAWIPLDDVDEAGGTVTFLDGSHRWRREGLEYFDVEGTAFFNQDLDLSPVSGRHGPVHPIPAVLKRGQVSFHHCKTIHGSGPNLSGAARRVLTVHLQPADNCYRANVRADGTPAVHASDRLCALKDDQPDYTDPVWFPTVWPVGGASDASASTPV